MSELIIKVIFDTGNSDEKVEKTGKSVNYLDGSLGKLEQNLAKAKAEFRSAIKGTEDWTVALDRLKKAQDELTQFQNQAGLAVSNTTRASANATVTLQALNYTLRDSPYFFRDFQLGVLAVGNNLNPLIDGFLRLRQANDGWKGAIKELTTQLSGIQGIIFFFSFLVTAIQAYTFALGKKKSAEKENEDQLKELIEKYKTLSEKIEDAKEKFLSLKSTDTKPAYRGLIDSLIELNQKLEEAIRKKREFDELNKSQEGRPSLPSEAGGAWSYWNILGQGAHDDIKKYGEQQILKRRQVIAENDLFSDLRKFYEGEISTKGVDASWNREWIKKVAEKMRTEADKMTGEGTYQIGIGDIIFDATQKQLLAKADQLDEILHPKKKKKEDLLGFEEESKLQQRIDYLKKYIALQKEGSYNALMAQKELDEVLKKRSDPLDIGKKYEEQQKEFAKNAWEYHKNRGDEDEKYAEEKEKFLKELSRKELDWEVETEDNRHKIRVAKIENEFDDEMAKLEEARSKGYFNKTDGTLDDDAWMTAADKLLDRRDNLKKIEDQSEATRKLKKENEGLNSIATQAGDALFNAFIHGKAGIDQLLISLVEVLAKLALVEGFKYIISGGTLGLFASNGGIAENHTHGGIVGFDSGGLVAGNSYMSDTVIAGLNSREMILNLQQQRDLFNFIRRGSAISNISSGTQVIKVEGGFSMKKDSFVADFRRAESSMNARRKLTHG